VVHSACRVNLSRLDSGALQMISELTFAATGACRPGAGHGVHCVCWLCGVHGVAHVPALGARSPDCGYVGPDEDVEFFEGGVCHTRSNLEFGP
jgi:hypothetical protein